MVLARIFSTARLILTLLSENIPVVLSGAAPADSGDPCLQRLDIGLEFGRLGHSSPRRSRLIVQPFRALRHGGIEKPAILFGDICDSDDVLRLHAGPEPFHNALKENFFERAFPPCAQQAV